MKYLVYITFFLPILLLTACGGGNSQAADTPQPATVTPLPAPTVRPSLTPTSPLPPTAIPTPAIERVVFRQGVAAAPS